MLRDVRTAKAGKVHLFSGFVRRLQARGAENSASGGGSIITWYAPPTRLARLFSIHSADKLKAIVFGW